jgi:hypothetical protein
MGLLPLAQVNRPTNTFFKLAKYFRLRLSSVVKLLFGPGLKFEESGFVTPVAIGKCCSRKKSLELKCNGFCWHPTAIFDVALRTFQATEFEYLC